MPELPEVENVVRGLQNLVGQKLENVEINDKKVWFESDLQAKDFAGHTLRALTRRGKYLVFDFQDRFLVQHLRMTGKMLASDSPAIPQKVRKNRLARKQLRAQFHFARNQITFYDTRRFGTITAVRNIEKFWQTKHFAPDPLHTPTAALAHMEAKFRSSKRPLKSALLDQSIVAGVGNIYADEALHRQKLHPLRKTNTLSKKEIHALFQSLVNIFKASIAAKGTTVINYVNAAGESGEYSKQLLVYDRKHALCKSCGQAQIQVRKIAGRSSHFCPVCQRK